jgi:hypothetical protein
MNQDWKKFTRAVTHELRDENLSSKERNELVGVAAMLTVTRDDTLPNEALLERILKETAVATPSAHHTSPESKKRYRSSFSSLALLVENILSKKKWLLASGGAALLVLGISLSFSTSEKAFVAEQSWLPELENPSITDNITTFVTTGSLSKKVSQNTGSEAESDSNISPQQSENTTNTDIDTLLAFTHESEASTLTFDEDIAFQNMDQDVDSLTQLYDENSF